MPRNGLRWHRDTVEGDSWTHWPQDHFTQQKRSVPRSKNRNRTILRNTLKTTRKSTFSCTAAHFADGPLHRDHVPAMLLGDSRSLQSEPPSLLSKPHPCTWVRNNWDSVSNMSQTCCELCTWTDAQVKKKALFDATEIKKNTVDGWING